MPKKATFISLLLHIAAMAVMFMLGYAIPPLAQKTPILKDAIPLHTRFLLAPRGGGSDRSDGPPRKGRAPERPMRRVFAPMMPRIEQPQLPLEVAMLDAPDAFVPADQVGDPFSRFPSGKSGSNGLLGIGPGDGPGVGPGSGKAPLLGSSTATTQRITRPPLILFHPEPEYSEDARKARFQGSVVLSVVVGKDGRTSEIKVVRGAGFGLDEKAIEAVKTWRFRPAMSGDQAIATPALVEVHFHLL